MSETRHEAAIERLYESLHDHDLLTTPDPKWTDAGERIKGGFTHAYEAALGTCAVDHETAVYTDNSNDGMAYRGHCETCTWKGPRRGSSEGAQVDCRQHLEVAYPFREAALGAEGELGGALRRAAEGLDLAASSLRGTGSNQNAEFAEQDSREARAALAGQAEVEATPFDDDRVRHVIEAVPASAIGVGDDIMSTDLIRRVHDVKPYVAVIPGTENNGLSFDLGDRWQRYEDAEPVYRVRALPDDTSAQPARNPTCVNCRHPASVHSQDGFHACRVADCTCTELVAGDDTSAQEERAAVDKREAQGRAWDAYAATNNHDRGAALRAGFDAGVEWAEEYGESSMVKFFVDQDAAARTPQDVLESDGETPGKRLWDRIQADGGTKARHYWHHANPAVRRSYERVGAEIEGERSNDEVEPLTRAELECLMADLGGPQEMVDVLDWPPREGVVKVSTRESYRRKLRALAASSPTSELPSTRKQDLSGSEERDG